MTRPDSDSLHGLRCGVLAPALALSLAACGSVSPSPNGAPNTQAAGVNLSGSATLTWTPVTQNSDDTPLSDLAGYKVYYGTSAGAPDSVVVLPDPSATSYLVTGLSSGTWYFAVAAYTSGGTQGASSNVVAKMVY